MLSNLPLELIAQIINYLGDPDDLNAIRRSCRDGRDYVTNFTQQLSLNPNHLPLQKNTQIFIKCHYVKLFPHLQRTRIPIRVIETTDFTAIATMLKLEWARLAIFFQLGDTADRYPRAYLNDNDFEMDDAIYVNIANFLNQIASTSPHLLNRYFRVELYEHSRIMPYDIVSWKPGYLSISGKLKSLQVLERYSGPLLKLSPSELTYITPELVESINPESQLCLDVCLYTFTEYLDLTSILSVITRIHVRVSCFIIYDELRAIKRGLDGLGHRTFPNIIEAKIMVSPNLVSALFQIFPHTRRLNLVQSMADLIDHRDIYLYFKRYPQLETIGLYTHSVKLTDQCQAKWIGQRLSKQLFHRPSK